MGLGFPEGTGPGAGAGSVAGRRSDVRRRGSVCEPAPWRYDGPMAVTAAPPPALDRRFLFTERRTTLRTEVLGGLSTFLTMSYILFVNPAILAAAKVPLAGAGVAHPLAPAVGAAG